MQYRFADFTVSTARRTLSRPGEAIPLIPRYFDLLVLLLSRRDEAVRRQEIFDAVWADVAVSDGALTQAIRTLRRALGDSQREPRFIQTVSRYGYRFIFADVVEEEERAGSVATRPARVDGRDISTADRPARFEEAIGRLIETSRQARLYGDEEWREAAETLHALGTAEALQRLGQRSGHERARALLREARWSVKEAGPVPLLGQPGGLVAASILVVLRLRGASSLAINRWAAACAGGAAAGLLAGVGGGLALRASAASDLPWTVVPALALVGSIAGAIGASGVGAGLAAAEALARSWRGTALVACGAAGGMAVGAVAHLLGAWTVAGIFGRDVSAAGGALEGLVLGAAAGAGYALSTPRPTGGGMATPRGAARARAAAVTGLFCAAAGVVLAALGGRLVGMSLDLVSHAFQGSQVALEPLARIFGESEIGFRTTSTLAAGEGFLFGAGLVFGITHRPR